MDSVLQDLAPNVNLIVNFLDNILDRDYLHLVAISSIPKLRRKDNTEYFPIDTFFAQNVQMAAEWAAKKNKEEFNIYYQYNIPRKHVRKKADAKDLAWLWGCHADVDCPFPPGDKRDDWFKEAKQNILGLFDFGEPHLIMTGNGLQVLYDFEEPLKATEQNINLVEKLNLKLRYALDGDACHDAPRILRVAGTVNHPSPKKQEKGYEPVLAKLIKTATEYFVPDDFRNLEDPPPNEYAPKRVSQRRNYGHHDYSIGYEEITYKQIMKTSPQIARKTQDVYETPPPDGGRSESAATFICALIHAMVKLKRVNVRDFNDDIRKNMFHIVLECGLDFTTRYRDKGIETLGYDIERAENYCADVFYTNKDKHTFEEIARVDRLNTEPVKTWTQEDCEVRIRHFFREHCPVETLIDLEYDNKGNRKSTHPTTFSNIRACLKDMRIKLRWDAMRDMVEYTFTDKELRKWFGQAVKQMLPHHIEFYIEALIISHFQTLGMRSKGDMQGYIREIASLDMFHPLENYCLEKKWDGVERIQQIADHIESDHPLADTYVRLIFLQAIGAIKSLDNYKRTGDGLQIGSIVILVGDEGIRKSEFFKIITPNNFMSSGSTLGLGTAKETDYKREVLSGMIAVLNEITHSTRRSDNEAMKNFVTSTFDEYRPAYARRSIRKPRITQICGTSNAMEIMDHTGSRRFLPMRVTHIDYEAIRGIDLQQCYAEAYHAVVNDKENWWLTGEEDAERAIYNETFRAASQEEAAITDYLTKVTTLFTNEWLTLTQICKLLDIKYVPRKAGLIHKVLLANDVRYIQTLRRKNKNPLKKVFHFPIAPEQLDYVRKLFK